MAAYGAWVTTRALLPLYPLLFLLAGCVTRISEPAPVGQGVYMMLGSTWSLLASTFDVVTEAERRASSFCASSGGKALQVVRVDTAEPDAMSFPEGRLQFRCVELAQDMASGGTELN